MKYRGLILATILLTVTAALLLLFNFVSRTQAVVAAVPTSPNVGPMVLDIQPNSAPNDINTPVVIQGSGFSATISGTQAMTIPTVYLGEHQLSHVTWVDTTTLSATIPWKLEPKVYPLTVVNPDGVSGTLPDAFTVINNLPVINAIQPGTAPNDIGHTHCDIWKPIQSHYFGNPGDHTTYSLSGECGTSHRDLGG
jgi:hypothetical protein